MNLIKKWCMSSLLLFLPFFILFLICLILSGEYFIILLSFITGSVLSFLLFLFLGIRFTGKICNKISKLNNLVKNSVPNDVSSRNLYSTDNTGDEIERLNLDIENVVFEIKSSERMKNDFISSMSHEIRTPLTAIKGWAETIRMGDLIDFANIRKGLDIIIKEVSRLSEIVDELLQFSVLANGKLISKKEKMDILAEIGEAIYIFKEKASIEQKRIIYNEPKSSICVYGDKKRLKQVFVNILDNALKYANSEVSIIVSEKDESVSVEITDNGCGIDKEDLKNITQKFFKVRNNKSGFGIGLSIVEEILRDHKGSLRILSEKGVGTTVIVTLKKVSTKQGNVL